MITRMMITSTVTAWLFTAWIVPHRREDQRGQGYGNLRTSG